MSTRWLHLSRALLGAALTGLFAGCFETTQEFTVNPDGSGKVVHESTFQNMELVSGQHTNEAAVRLAIAEFLRTAQGVEAWRDLSYHLADDGRIYFKGTAYFRDLSGLKLPNQTMVDFTWQPAKQGGTLGLRPKEEKAAAKATAAPATPEERARAIKEGRAKFQQAKPMMQMILGTMKHDVVFHLPGKPGQPSVFTADADGALRLHCDGTRMLAAMDKLVSDDAWIARNADSFGGGAAPADEADANFVMFGDKRPARVAVTNATSPLFDYESEVAEAKAASAAQLQELAGPAAPPPAPPAQSGELKSIRVVGVRLVAALDERLELQPLGSGPGVTLALLAELPGSVQAVTDEGVLASAIGGDGSDLLPESEFERKIHFPHLSADKATVLIEVQLRAPGAGVTTLKELSGHLQYTVAGAPAETDLGLARLAAGAKGKALGAEIMGAENGEGAACTFELHLLVKPDALKALYLVRGKNRTELRQSGYGGGNGDYVYTYESPTGLPAGARLVAEVYGSMDTFDAPFTLTNVPLPTLPQ